MTSKLALSRRQVLRLAGVSATSLVCASCASNPFFPTETRAPQAWELLTFHPARKSRAEVVKLAKKDERQIILRQHYLKLVAGRHGSDYVVGEKFAFTPREADGGISVAELSDKKLAALLRDARVKEEATPTMTTVIGWPADNILNGQWHPDTPFVSLTPSLLNDGKIRLAFTSHSGAAVLTQPFELDLERDRWYAILLDVARSPDGSMPREHLCCLRVELP
jgi:hypothetical protein